MATASGVHPFLRVLYARFAQRVCPDCGTAIEVLTGEEGARAIEVDGGARAGSGPRESLTVPA